MKEYVSYEEAVELVKDRCLNPDKYTLLEIGEAYVLADKFFDMTQACEIEELQTNFIPYWSASCNRFKEYLLAHEEKAMQQLLQRVQAVLDLDKITDGDWGDILAVCYAYLCITDKNRRTHLFWNKIYNTAAAEIGLPNYCPGKSFLASRQETEQQKEVVIEELKGAKTQTEVDNLLDTLSKVNKYLNMSGDL